jgi:hypothetical protein
MTFQDRVTSTFLTDFVNIAHSNSMKLASIFRALKLGLGSLEAFYGGIQGKGEGSEWPAVLKSLLPYSFWLKPKFSFKKRIDGQATCVPSGGCQQARGCH